MRTHDSTPLPSGWDVYGADGVRIGTIADTSNNFFVIEKRSPRAADLFVPFSAIAAVAGERVELKFTEAELEAGNFTSPIGEERSNRDSDVVVDSMHASRRAIRRP